jgi:hypothetical protein
MHHLQVGLSFTPRAFTRGTPPPWIGRSLDLRTGLDAAGRKESVLLAGNRTQIPRISDSILDDLGYIMAINSP